MALEHAPHRAYQRVLLPRMWQVSQKSAHKIRGLSVCRFGSTEVAIASLNLRENCHHLRKVVEITGMSGCCDAALGVNCRHARLAGVPQQGCERAAGIRVKGGAKLDHRGGGKLDHFGLVMAPVGRHCTGGWSGGLRRPEGGASRP